MILSLTIAWCLLSIPVGIVLGKCMRLGLHGSQLAVAHDVAPAGDERRGADVPDVPQQRRPAAAPSQLQDA